jgi:hypothetical protein
MWLKKPKNLHVSWQFDFELIMHQAPPMAVPGGQNLMGVVQKDEFFNKLNTTGELKF